MRLIDEALKLTDLDQLHEEIQIRRKTANEMLGWLYKSVLQDEILKLLDRIDGIRYGNGSSKP